MYPAKACCWNRWAGVQGHIVALPDADQSPEQICGLAPGVASEKQFARRLAESGFQVVVPTLVDRSSRWSGNPAIRMTDQPHREWIYRQAFHMGRHVIGYEVQKVLAAVDWFERTRGGQGGIGVAGYAEGGLLAFYAAAVDTRIHAALVSGYFSTRQDVWSEPIYRNVWSLLREFGDAEVASLIAPRGLVIEYSRVPEIQNPRGNLKTPPFAAVRDEFSRLNRLFDPMFQPRQLVAGPDGEPTGPGSPEAMNFFAAQMNASALRPLSSAAPADARRFFSSDERQKRQVKGLEKQVQSLIRGSETVRQQFFLYKVMPELADETWSMRLRHATFPAAKFIEGAKPYRQYFREEILGTFDESMLPPNPRTRRVYDNPKWTGYEVVLDVWPEVFAWGILLLPKDIKPGERRPVVVCQHGRHGLPKDVSRRRHFVLPQLCGAAGGRRASSPSRRTTCIAAKTAIAGYAARRTASRRRCSQLHLSQHDQILRWLATLPMWIPAALGFTA